MIIPLIVIIIILYGTFKKINVYDKFLDGVKESFSMIYTLFPTFLAMIFGISLFINSGFLTFILSLLNPFFKLINIPSEILPLAVIRPISGSASLAYLTNIYSTFGPDSHLGLLSSVMQGSTDTTFYVLTLYFGTIGIKKIKYSLFAGLCADLIGIIASIIVVKLLF